MMLEELLKIIREGGSFDTGLLAKKLNTTPEMILAMMDHLRRAGMLKTYEPGQSSCEFCSLSGNCDPARKQHEIGHLWLYDDK
ncbi:MAG: FeoC-like transcriptional regulator [Anaerolineaceae bacterium]